MFGEAYAWPPMSVPDLAPDDDDDDILFVFIFWLTTAQLIKLCLFSVSECL